MKTALPTQAEVVIVGGGIIGCSIAYHLTRAGIRDVVLIERGTLTCGTSWHAAGLIMGLRTTPTLTKLCSYGADLYDRLEAETGQATGFRRVGSLPVARTQQRMIELRRLASQARLFDLECHVLTPSEVVQRHPMIDAAQVVGGLWIPGDGTTNPIDTTMALARGARQGGAKIVENCAVTDLVTQQGRITQVVTDHGTITCDKAVLCAGIWTRDLARLAGVNVPLYASEHMYITTEPMAGATPGLPVIRDTDGYVYIKEDAGKLLVGAFEPKSKPLPMQDLPARFEFGELQEDWEHFELPMTKAMQMVPELQHARIRHFMNGPESFTPDNNFILGQAPEVRDLFVAAGFNSQGILSGAGVGQAMADWIQTGAAQMDLADLDIARFQPFQTNRRYLSTRIEESLGLLYGMHWPHRQVESARMVRRSPLHSQLGQKRAVFGETAGWERANWFASEGQEPAYDYSWSRQNWFEAVGREHMAVREKAGLFDLSSFAKFEIRGRDAVQALQRVAASDLDVAVGKIVYSQLLNPRGGIVSDCTITRIAGDRFWLVDMAANQNRTMTWLGRSIDPDLRVAVSDITSGWGVLSLMGPRSRDILNKVSPHDFSLAAFPFGTMQQVEIGLAKAYAFRVSFVGELGWEIYAPAEFMAHIHEELDKAGADFGMLPAGYHALDSLRLEKGYRHWGHDIGDADTPLEAGLGFALAWDKPGDFTGKAALLEQRGKVPVKRMVHILMKDTAPFLYHDEPIWRDGQLVGSVTSGSQAYALGFAVGLGYLHCPDGVTKEYVNTGAYEVEIAAERHPAEISLRPFFDPGSERMKV